MKKCLNNMNSVVFDEHNGKKAIKCVNEAEDTIEKWTKELSKKYDESNKILSYNYEEYHKGNQMFPKFFIIKIWTQVKYYAWIFHWYLTTPV